MKKVLVYGLGVSGVSSVKALDKLGYEIYTYDKEKITNDEIEGYNYSPISVQKLTDYDYDFVVKSPGIKPDDDIIQLLKDKYEIISDIELSYRLFKDKEFFAITGTNGKTSTTSMITHILNNSGIKAISVGNIGEGILWKMYQEDAVFVEELSSFQLKHTKDYHPHIAAILNISPDHIDRHGDYGDYIYSKFNIAKNQTEEDFLILNGEDKLLMDNKENFKAQIYEFSSKRKVNRGIYLKEDRFILVSGDREIELLSTNELKIIGRHNFENMMVAILATHIAGIDLGKIVNAAKSFTSIEHRLEFVDNVNNVKIYNDSKGTNVDSSIKAIDSFKEPIILIAGGYDKKIDYTDFVKEFKNNGKLMILLGETKYELKDICDKYDINYVLVDDMDEAVREAIKNATAGDVILLSPASASWDMYESYEVRGRDFKEKIEKYKGKLV